MLNFTNIHHKSSFYVTIMGGFIIVNDNIVKIKK
jgi:hypothetical protein